MRPFLMIILVVELALAIFVVSNGYILRTDMIRAINDYRKNPTQQTRLEVKRQQLFTNLFQVGIGTVIFGAFAIPTIVIFRRKREDHPQTHNK